MEQLNGNGMEWNGMEWNRKNEIKLDSMNGMERNGMEWKGNGMELESNA